MNIRELKGLVEPFLNRLLKKTYIPEPKTHLYLEPTNLCNLKCKFCAYPKVNYKKRAQSNEVFEKIINDATTHGFKDFGLTPITGEVFADKTIEEKILFLESHEGVESFSFYSNFVLASEERINFLLSLKKLSRMSISIYGHDFESFSSLTKGSRRQYDRLVNNLNYLSSKYQRNIPFELEVALRTTKDFDKNMQKSDLWDGIKAFDDSVTLAETIEYDNWGGLVTQEDLNGININLKDKPVKKIGACALIFYKNQVHSDGKVNACACRDVTRSMEIGDINEQSFAEIYSTKNQKLMGLIESQQRGEFSPICDNCSFYRSIYTKYNIYDQKEFQLITLQDYLESLSKE